MVGEGEICDQNCPFYISACTKLCFEGPATPSAFAFAAMRLVCTGKFYCCGHTKCLFRCRIAVLRPFCEMPPPQRKKRQRGRVFGVAWAWMGWHHFCIRASFWALWNSPKLCWTWFFITKVTCAEFSIRAQSWKISAVLKSKLQKIYPGNSHENVRLPAEFFLLWFL